MKVGAGCLAGLCAALLAVPALAHHSFAMFDSRTVMILDGTVRGFIWTNPHSWIRISVSDAAGRQLDWMIEMSSSSEIARRGWSPMTIKPGDRVTIAAHPAKHEPKMAQYVAVKLPDGTTLTENPNFKL